MANISNPPTPYMGHIIGNFTDGKTVVITGLVLPPAQRIIINFQTGKNAPHKDDIAFHLSAKLLEGIIIRNSLIEGVWGTEERAGHYPLVVGKKFIIAITNQRPKYIIKVNDDQFEFKHRLPGSRVNHLSIQGDVKLYNICYEANPSCEKFIPLYDDPPPPYSEFPPETGQQQDDSCILQTALPALAVGTGIGVLGASLLGNRSRCHSRSCGVSCHCEKCRCSQCRRTFKPPSKETTQTTEPSSSSWATLGAGVAAVGIIGAVGGLIYSLAKSSSNNDSDDD